MNEIDKEINTLAAMYFTTQDKEYVEQLINWKILMENKLKHGITTLIYDDDPMYPILIIKSDKFIRFYAIDINTGELEELEL